MKTLILTIAVFVLSTLSVQAQDIEKLKDKQWIWYSCTYENNKEVIIDTKNLYMISFDQDGTYLSFSQCNDMKTGNWSYNSTTKIITLKIDNRSFPSFKIISLTDSVLITEESNKGSSCFRRTYKKSS